MISKKTSNFKPLLVASLLGLTISSLAFAVDEYSCPYEGMIKAKQAEKEKLETRLQEANQELAKYTNIKDPVRESAYNNKRFIEQQLDAANVAIHQYEFDCNRDQENYKKKNDKLTNAEAECLANMDKYPGYFEWDAGSGECVRLRNEAKGNPYDGECSDAELFKGDGLKGEACKRASDKASSVTARNQALGQSAAMLTTGYAGMQAQQSTGFQDDAFRRQQNVMKAMAISKMVTGGMALTGAMELKSAAGEAESASSNISDAHQKLLDICENAKDLESQQCFYKNAGSVGIDPDEKSYATFSRMKNAAAQSQDAADRANEMAKVSMISGFADAVVGMQAMRAAKQAQQFNGNMGMVPNAPPPVYQFNPGTGGSQGGGLGAPLAPPAPDYGVPGDDTMYLGGPSDANIHGGLETGTFIAPNNYKPGHSGVSGANAGSPGGAAAGGASRGMPGNDGRKRGPYNTTAGEYNLAAGGGTASGSGKSANKKEEGSNPFAEALAKLFPQDEKSGKPVVDVRGIASTGRPVFDESFVVGKNPDSKAEELSIFEQVTAKYRSLTYSGKI